MNKIILFIANLYIFLSLSIHSLGTHYSASNIFCHGLFKGLDIRNDLKVNLDCLNEISI